jgi:hypothetical protein
VHQLEIEGLRPDILDRADVLQRTCNHCVNHKCCEDQCLRVHTQLQSDLYAPLVFKLSHTDPIEADFEPTISWLMFCRDLQSLQINGIPLPFDIEIIMKHSYSKIWTNLGWSYTEMDLLEEYANTQQHAAYLCDWIEAARCKTNGIEYNTSKTGETFIIRLNKLEKPLPRGLPPKVWKSFFKWKWRWLGQKYMNTSVGGFPDIQG